MNLPRRQRYIYLDHRSPWTEFSAPHRSHQLAIQDLSAGASVVSIFSSSATPAEAVLPWFAEHARRLRNLDGELSAVAYNGASGCLEEWWPTFGKCLSVDDWLDDGLERTAVRVNMPSREVLKLLVQLERRYPVVYDCFDNWSGFPQDFLARVCDGDTERSIISLSDGVSFVTSSLAKKHGTLSVPVQVCSNGAPDLDGSTESMALKERNGRVLCLGTFSPSRFDWPLVDSVVEMYSHIQFDFAGRLHKLDSSGREFPLDVPLLASVLARDNVEALGELRPQDVLRVLPSYDAVLLPYLLSESTVLGCPLKAHEAARCGTPMIASDVPFLRDFPLVSIIEDPGEFGAAYKRGYSLEPSERVAAIEQMQRSSWRIQAERMRRFTAAVAL